jgi:poly(3-hydroxybutyrate) depolymerase
LHGAGESAAHGQPLTKLLENRSLPWHAENGSRHLRSFLLICPQLESRRRWEASDAPRIDELVRQAAREHQADPARLALTGFSLGGEGVFQIAAASELDWPSLWAVDPALQRVPPAPPSSARVLVHHGAQQPGSENMAAFATSLGLSVQASARSQRVLKVLRQDHPRTCSAAYADTQAYAWLAHGAVEHA